MLTHWFSQPTGARSSTDDGKGGEIEDDTQVMEPDQGNGELLNRREEAGRGYGTRLTISKFSRILSPSCGLVPI